MSTPDERIGEPAHREPAGEPPVPRDATPDAEMTRQAAGWLPGGYSREVAAVAARSHRDPGPRTWRQAELIKGIQSVGRYESGAQPMHVSASDTDSRPMLAQFLARDHGDHGVRADRHADLEPEAGA